MCYKKLIEDETARMYRDKSINITSLALNTLCEFIIPLLQQKDAEIERLKWQINKMTIQLNNRE